MSGLYSLRHRARALYRLRGAVFVPVFCLLAVLLAACNGKRPSLDDLASSNEDSLDTISAKVPVLLPGRILVFGVDSSGHYHLLDQNGTDASTAVQASPRPFALQTMPLALQALSGDSLLVATNRSSVMRLDLKPQASGQRLALTSLGGDSELFRHSTVAPAWAVNQQAYFLLFRHPFADALLPPTNQPASDPADSRILVSDGSNLSVWSLYDHYLALTPSNAGSLYAVFPVSATTWYVQYRRVNQDSVESTYARWQLDNRSQHLLSRAAFEAALAPKTLAQAPELVQRAAAALSGNLLLDTVLLDGSRQVYLRGDQSTTQEAFAHIGVSGVCLVLADGSAVFAAHGAAELKKLSLPRPVSQVRFGQVAVLSDAVVVLWEEDLFPDVGRSGFMVLSLLD